MSSKVMIRYVNGLVFEWTYYISAVKCFWSLTMLFKKIQDMFIRVYISL